MSVEVMSLVWKANLGTTTRKLIMLRLADFSNVDGHNIFPSVGRIANDTGADRRTIQRALRAFMVEGLLHVVKPGGNNGEDTTHYKLDIARLQSLIGGDDMPGGDSKPPQERRRTAPGAAGSRPRGGSGPPNPLRDPSSQPSRQPSEAAAGDSNSNKSPSILPAGILKKESPPLPLKEQLAAVDDTDASDEERFWVAVDVLSKAGVPRSQMVKLAKLSDGFDECLATLKRVAEARGPATYLAKIVHNLKAEASAMSGIERPGEPAFVREFRLAGYDVELDKDGKRWWCGGTTYNSEGMEV